MHVAFGRVRRKSRSVADDTDYGIGDGGRWSGLGNCLNRDLWDYQIYKSIDASRLKIICL